MEKYTAFMRGVNVGGKNKVSMPELKELLEQNGFDDVVTYINSGNIIFSSDNADEKRLKEEFEGLIANKFQLNIPIIIVSVNDLLTAFNHAPSWWGQDKDKDSKHNAIFIKLLPLHLKKHIQKLLKKLKQTEGNPLCLHCRHLFRNDILSGFQKV